MSRVNGTSPPTSPNEYLLTPEQESGTSPRRGSVNAGVNLVSPREYRHGARKLSTDGSRRGSMIPESRRGSSVSVMSMADMQKAACLSVFSSKEVKELLAVGDKVWTADRRVPANVSIRSAETGEIEKELKPPNKTDYESKDKVKEHIFPWSLIHVKFPKAERRQPEYSTSDEEESQAQPRSMHREGSITARRRASLSTSNRGSSQLKRVPSKGPSAPPPKGQTGSSGKRQPPKQPVEEKRKMCEYVDEVWVGYSNGSIRCFDAITGQFIEEMKEQGGVYCMLLWGEYVYSGSNDWTIRKWDAAKKVVIGQFLPGETGHSNSVRAVQIAGTSLATGSDDFTIRLWDHALVGQDSYSTTGRCTKVLTGHKASVLTLAWCEKRLWSGSEDATVMVWDIERGVALRTLTDTRHVVTKLVALPRIHRVMCCSVDNVVRVYDGRSMRLVSELEGHTGFVHSCAPVATELRYVVWSSSQDGTLRVWQVAGDDKPESTSKFVRDMDENDDAHYLRWKISDHEARESALQRELDDLRNKHQLARQEADNNRNQLKQLEHANRLQEDELADLRGMQDEFNDEHERRTMLQNDLADRDGEIAKLKRELQRLRGENDREGDDKAAHLRTIADLRKELEALRGKFAAAEEAKEGAQARLADLQQHLDREKYKLDEESKRRLDEHATKENLLAQLQQQLDDALDERDRYMDEARNLSAVNADLKKRLSIQAKDINRQKGDAKSLSELEADTREAIRLERDLLNQAVGRQQAELLAMQEALDRKSIQCLGLENVLSIMNTRAAIYETRANGMEAASMMNDSLAAELAALKAKLNARTHEAEKVPGMLSTIEENEQLLDSLRRELDAAKTKLQDNEDELEQIRNELDSDNAVKRKNGMLADELSDIRKSKEKLQKELADVREKLHAVEDERDALQDEVDRLRGIEIKARNSGEETDKLLSEMGNLRDKSKKLTGERDDLQKDLDACKAELAEMRDELDELRKLKTELDDIRAERDTLQEEKETWEEKLRQIRSEIDDREARVARSEEVLAGMRLESSELEEKLRKMKEREAELAAEMNSDRSQLEDLMSRMQEEQDSEHYNFILRSRTDFIQAVYDWLLCSAMARRHAKKSDLTAPGAMDALIAAIEGAYKRGHYILSNYVSELEKHHLGVSPSLYPPDLVLQQMFRSQRSECEKFLRGNPAKANLASITRLGVVVEGSMAATVGSSQGSPRLSRRSPSKEVRSFTPPAAYRRAHSELGKRTSRTYSPPAKAVPQTLRRKQQKAPLTYLPSALEPSSPTRTMSRTLSSPVAPPAAMSSGSFPVPRGGSPLPRGGSPSTPVSPEIKDGSTGALVFKRQLTVGKRKVLKKAKA